MPACRSALAPGRGNFCPELVCSLARSQPARDRQDSQHGTRPGYAPDRVRHRTGGYPELRSQSRLSLPGSKSPTALCDDLRRQFSHSTLLAVVAGAVPQPVKLVLSCRAIAQVHSPVVLLAARTVPALATARALPNKRLQHQQMHSLERDLAVLAETHTKVTLSRYLLSKDPPRRSVTRQRPYTAQNRNFVQPLIPADAAPFFTGQVFVQADPPCLTRREPSRFLADGAYPTSHGCPLSPDRIYQSYYTVVVNSKVCGAGLFSTTLKGSDRI
jgi:hypothetical protein